MSGRNQFAEIKSKTVIIASLGSFCQRQNRRLGLALGHDVDNNNIQPYPLSLLHFTVVIQGVFRQSEPTCLGLYVKLNFNNTIFVQFTKLHVSFVQDANDVNNFCAREGYLTEQN